MLRESTGKKRKLTWRSGTNSSFSNSKSSKDYMLYRRAPSIVHPQIEETLEHGILWEGGASALQRRFKMSKWKKIYIRITASTLSFYINDQTEMAEEQVSLSNFHNVSRAPASKSVKIIYVIQCQQSVYTIAFPNEEAANKCIHTIITNSHSCKFFASGAVEDRNELEIQEKIGNTSSGNISKGKYRDKVVCVYQYAVQNRHILNQYGKIGYKLFSHKIIFKKKFYFNFWARNFF